MKPACVCTHGWDVHQHSRSTAGTDCPIHGCGCPRYRQPRWWRRTPKTPAGDDDPAALPRAAADSPLPGQPVWIHDVRYREAGCGCFEVINHIRHTSRLDRCQRHAFEAHWEDRIRQS